MSNLNRKFCLFVRQDLADLKNDFFDNEELYGMKSDTYMYRDLRNYYKQNNIDLNTQITNLPEDCEVVICVNETEYFVNYKRSKNNRLLVLILTEPPVYNEMDWKHERHLLFDKVFTYDSDLIESDLTKYIHINYPIDIEFIIKKSYPSEKEFNLKKHACLVASAISITKPPLKHKSLLYERYKILKWYNRYRPNQLDFYSRTNPTIKFKNFRGASLINKISKTGSEKIGKLLFKYSISKVYKGAIPSLNKNSTLSNYKFNYCLENTHSIKGLISEKIFDCFLSQTIPIYLGASDIENYIPKNTYILFSDYKNISDLNHYLTKMEHSTYLQYLKNATNFLLTAHNLFSTQTFVKKIYNETTS